MRRRRKSTPGAELDYDQLYELETGSPMSNGDGFQDGIEAMRSAWESIKDEFLTKYIEVNPCHRPFAWWLFEHGKERPIINHSKGFNREVWERYGFLHTCLHDGNGNCLQQPENEYLYDHDLLTDTERSLVVIHGLDQFNRVLQGWNGRSAAREFQEMCDPRLVRAELCL